MSRFQILCVTMHQKDFSKIKEMNIHSDVIFANQANENSVQEHQFDEHTAKMITTTTRGVGKNRNIALLYADADYCLFADDDCSYIDNVESIILKEFEDHPDADVFIFHLASDDPVRVQRSYKKTFKYHRWMRRPWGGVRIAFKLDSMKRANLWFNTLFGGGCLFPSGEDSMWINDAVRKGLTFYVSKYTVGHVEMSNSTWFTGTNEKYFFAKGAHFQHEHKNTILIWMIYFALRTAKMSNMKFFTKIKWMNYGRDAYKLGEPFDVYKKKHDIKEN